MMTVKTVITRFGLYFLGAIIVATIVANVFNLKLHSIDMILTMALLNSVVSKFLIDNNRELTKQEYWQIFVGAFGINIAYSLLTLMLVSLTLELNTTIVMTALGFGIFAGLISVALGLWMGQRMGRKAMKVVLLPVKVYSVTDEGIASYLINLLSKHHIEAYIDNSNTGYDPLISSAHSGEVNIFLNNKNNYDSALEIINQFFQENENKQPWKCPKCHEEIDGTFTTCWNCGYEQN
jgi:hypothetical protein